MSPQEAMFFLTAYRRETPLAQRIKAIGILRECDDPGAQMFVASFRRLAEGVLDKEEETALGKPAALRTTVREVEPHDLLSHPLVVKKSEDRAPEDEGIDPPAATRLNLAQELAGSPAVSLSLGNVFLAANTAHPVGILLSSATSLATAGLTVIEHYTGRRIGLPYYVLSAVNAGTAGSVLYNGADTVGIEPLLTFQMEAMKYLLAAGAFSGWAIGHAVKGCHDAKQTKGKSFLGNEQTWYGAADVAAVHGNPYSSVFFVLGLAKALRDNPQQETNSDEVTSISALLKKHATSARLYGMGYIVGSLLSIKDPGFAAAQAAWGLGYLNFEAHKNKEFLHDVRNVMSYGFDWICTEFLSRRLADRSIVSEKAGDSQVNVAAFLVENFSSLDKIRLGLGFQKSHLWAKVADTVARIYPSIDENDKDAAFALLEVAACHSRTARRHIHELLMQGDVRAQAKSNRMVSALLGFEREPHPNPIQITRAKNLYASLCL